MIQKKSYRAFLTIEVLISIIIMFTAIVTLSSSIKSVVMFETKSSQYEMKYITVKSLLNYIYKQDFKLTFITTSYSKLNIKLKKLNGYKIDINPKNIDQAFFMEVDEFGNPKRSNIKSVLLKIKFILSKRNFKRHYEVYQTRVFK
jgi:hypothetical protein